MNFERSPQELCQPGSYFQAFLANSDDAFFEYDADLRCVAVNPAGAALFGLQPADLIGKLHSQWRQTQGDRALWAGAIVQMARALQQVLTTAAPHRIRCDIPAGTALTSWEMRLTPITDAPGAVVRIFVVGRETVQYSRKLDHYLQEQQSAAASSSEDGNDNWGEHDQLFLPTVPSSPATNAPVQGCFARHASEYRHSEQDNAACSQSTRDSSAPLSQFPVEQLESVLANIPGVIYRCRCDANWTMEFMSEAIADVSGYPAADFVHNHKRTFASIIHPSDVAKVQATVHEGIQRTQPFSLEYRIIRADGEICWVYERGRSLIEAGELWLDGAIFDITAYKQAELSLKEREGLLQLILDNVPQAIFWKDTHSVYLGCNRKWAEGAGLADPHHVVGKTDFDLPWTPEEANQYREWDRRIIENNKPELQVIISQRQASGQQIWTSMSKVPIHDEAGRVIGVLGTFEDITERKKAEELSKSAALFQLVLDNIPQFIFWKDRNSVYQGCNRRWAEMAGLGEPENAIGKTDQDLPWTPEEAEFYRECDRRIMASGQPETRLLESQRQADGKQTWREANKFPICNAAGEVIGILGTLEDITERRQAEEILRDSEAQSRQVAQREELLNHLSRQIRNSLDLTTILQTAVHEVRHLFDTDRVVVYRFHEDWQGTVVVEDVISPWVSVLGEMGQDDCFSAEYAGLYLQGRIRAIEEITTAGLDACHVAFLQGLQVRANVTVPILVRDQLWGLLIVHECRSPRAWQDWEVNLLQRLADQMAIAINQAEIYAQAQSSAAEATAQAQKLEQALRELRETQAQLVQNEKMSSLGQLVAGVAHEINNPVNFISGNLTYAASYIQDLKQLLTLYQRHYPHPASEIQAAAKAIDLEFVAADLSKVLDSMRLGTERIQQIVLSLRNFSRLDEAEKKPVDIHEGLDSTLLILQSRLKPAYEFPGIQVCKDYGQLPLIECYAGQLNQVFMNIICNAIDALSQRVQGRSPDLEQPQPLEIRIQTRMLAGDRLRIGIADNGPGIPAHFHNRLFDPFFTTKPIGEGTGLGLSISHKIVVDQHGGTLTYRSEVGKGTEFWIEIPVG